MSLSLQRRRALLLMVVAPTLWSIAGVFTRHLDAARGFEVTFWRSLFAGLCVVAVLLRQKGGAATLAMLRDGGRAQWLSGLMWAAMFVCFMIALTRTTVANTLIMMSIAPLVTALLARVVLHQQIAPRTWAAIAAAIAGICVMFADGAAGLGGQHLQGMLIAAVVPLAAAVNIVAIKRAGQQVDLIPAVLLGSAISAALMLPLAWPLQASLHDIALLAVLGVFQLGLPCMLMVVAVRHLSAPEVSLLALIEVVLGPLWTWWGAGEVPAGATLAGGAVVLGALVFNEAVGLRTARVAARRA